MSIHADSDDTAAIYAILDRAEYGTLALSAGDIPYAVPVNFVRVGEWIYLHGGKNGRKMEILSRNRRVSFSVVQPLAVIDSDFSSTDGLACPATQFFESVSIDGVVEIVELRDEKAHALQSLMEKLQPKGGYRPLNDSAYDKIVSATVILRIIPESITLKSKLGAHLSVQRNARIIEHLMERNTSTDQETLSAMGVAIPHQSDKGTPCNTK